jgi:hypothetical protein
VTDERGREKHICTWHLTWSVPVEYPFQMRVPTVHMTVFLVVTLYIAKTKPDKPFPCVKLLMF